MKYILFFIILILTNLFPVFSQVSIYNNQISKGIVYLNNHLINPNVTSIYNNSDIKEISTVEIIHSDISYSNNVIKSLNDKEILFPNEYVAFEIDKSTENIICINPTYELSPLCESAINRAPKWIHEDLHRSFRKLRKYKLDDDYSNLIINANASIVDEVSFQIANLSLETLIDSRFRSTIELLVDNAQFIYDVVDSLKYVRLIEYGDFNDKNYFTTTEYRIKDGISGDTIWSEIPKEIYYWYVVMPKIDREGVYKRDNTSSTQFRTYGHFWKNYIWNNPEPNYDYTQVNITTSKGTIDTIQRFGALMQQPEILWNRVQTYFPFKRSFDPDDHALDILGNWASRAIPVDASGNRPFEPQQALNEHNGNCHEDAILVTAACRTALIPLVHISVHGEDHAYGMFWDKDWCHYEFFRGGFSEKINPSFAGITNLMDKGSYSWTTSIAHASRADGYPDIFSSYYNDEICNLKVQVLDKDDNPIDGALVEFWCSPGPYSSGWMDNVGFAWTNHSGIVEVTVGAGKKYAYQVYHEDFGYLPTATTANILSQSNTVNGQTYSTSVNYINKSMPSLKLGTEQNLPSTANYGIHVDFSSVEIIAGQNKEDVQNSTFAYKEINNGAVSFFICDKINYDKFKSGQEFDHYYPVKYFKQGNMFLPLPEGDKWYVIFSNQEAVTNYQQLNATVELVKDAELSIIPDQITNLIVFPNPFSQRCTIESASKILSFEVYDIYGKFIERSFNNRFIWEPKPQLSKGTYIIKANLIDNILTAKIFYK